MALDYFSQARKLLMMYVRSIRESNFRLFVSSLRDIFHECLHWTICITGELLSLDVENWEILESFPNEYFIISKSRRTFSKLAINHAGAKQ